MAKQQLSLDFDDDNAPTLTDEMSAGKTSLSLMYLKEDSIVPAGLAALHEVTTVEVEGDYHDDVDFPHVLASLPIAELTLARVKWETLPSLPSVTTVRLTNVENPAAALDAVGTCQRFRDIFPFHISVGPPSRMQATRATSSSTASPLVG
jgi:hypothetical protein